MADNFHSRLGPHEVLVDRIIASINKSPTWFAERYGQSQLSQKMREFLKGCKTRIRWMADVIACNRQRAILIDAKAGVGYLKYGNHAVEKDALDAAIHEPEAVWFIFLDGRGISATRLAEMIHQDDRSVWTGTFRGYGSGTAFWVFKVEHTVPIFTSWQVPQIPNTNGA